MKKIVFQLFLCLLCSITANAQKKEQRIEHTYLAVKLDNEVIKYNFDTIKDLEENSDKILDEITANADTSITNSPLITIEIVITINTNLISTSISASTTNTSTNIAAIVKKLRA